MQAKGIFPVRLCCGGHRGAGPLTFSNEKAENKEEGSQIRRARSKVHANWKGMTALLLAELKG